ncbi:hypothetical protein [Bacillus sp. 491mf]|nr:hypothetical protein [Bacillus sp. 491mf]
MNTLYYLRKRLHMIEKEKMYDKGKTSMISQVRWRVLYRKNVLV